MSYRAPPLFAAVCISDADGDLSSCRGIKQQTKAKAHIEIRPLINHGRCQSPSLVATPETVRAEIAIPPPTPA